MKAATPQIPTPDQLRILCAKIHRVVEDGNPDAVKQLLRDLIDRVEITPDRQAYPFFWAPATCEAVPTTDKRGQYAQPAPTHQGDTGWLFVTSRGGGGNRTRVEQLWSRLGDGQKLALTRAFALTIRDRR